MEIFPISKGMSTAYLVVDDGEAMLVDAAYEGITPRVLATLTAQKAALRLIVLTHYHYDHVGAADSLREATGAAVAVHRLDAGNLRAGGKLVVRPTRLRAKLMAPLVEHGTHAAVSPDIELDDSEELAQYGGFGRAILTPGHTAGSISVLLPTNTLLVGDALTQTIVPPGLAEPPLFADDAEASKRSIVAIEEAGAGDVRVAHVGRVRDASLGRLAAKARDGRLTY